MQYRVENISRSIPALVLFFKRLNYFISFVKHPEALWGPHCLIFKSCMNLPIVNKTQFHFSVSFIMLTIKTLGHLKLGFWKLAHWFQNTLTTLQILVPFKKKLLSKFFLLYCWLLRKYMWNFLFELIEKNPAYFV